MHKIVAKRIDINSTRVYTFKKHSKLCSAKKGETNRIMSNSNMESNILSNIRAERVRRGYTQEKFANEIGMNHHTYNRKELGKTEFTVGELKKILEVLDCRPEQLF